jgi:SAM-dependent methyltransferase
VSEKTAQKLTGLSSGASSTVNPAQESTAGREYWDRTAGQKTFTLGLDMDSLRKWLSGPGDAILDCGCGYGRILLELREKGFSCLSGCDISPALLALAASDLPGVDLRLVTDDKLPFADSSFDALILLAVLTAVPGDAEQIRLVSEIRRVLRVGGIIYAGDFLLNYDDRNLRRYGGSRPNGFPYGVFTLPDGAVLRHHEPEWIDSLFSGFERLSMERVEHVTMNGHRANGFRLICRKN